MSIGRPTLEDATEAQARVEDAIRRRDDIFRLLAEEVSVRKISIAAAMPYETVRTIVSTKRAKGPQKGWDASDRVQRAKITEDH